MRAIIATAINDALGRSAVNDHPGNLIRNREQAMRWLSQMSQDFCAVCDSAGLNAECVSRAALAYIARERAALDAESARYPACADNGVTLTDIADHAMLRLNTVRMVLKGDARCTATTIEQVNNAIAELSARKIPA